MTAGPKPQRITCLTSGPFLVIVHNRCDQQQHRGSWGEGRCGCRPQAQTSLPVPCAQKDSMEDVKERFYNVCARLDKALTVADGSKSRITEHEKRSKDQLERLFDRRPEQVVEQAYPIQELCGIESRKKEHELKVQDVQRLIMAGESSREMPWTDQRVTKRRLS